MTDRPILVANSDDQTHHVVFDISHTSAFCGVTLGQRNGDISATSDWELCELCHDIAQRIN